MQETQTLERTELPELSFVHPIPGFSHLRRFVLVKLDEEDDPQDPADGAPALIYELRSLEDPAVKFVVVSPAAFFSDYEIELSDEDQGDLGLTGDTDALILVMLTVNTGAGTATANLLAPVVVNVRTRDAAQVILSGSDWPVRASLG